MKELFEFLKTANTLNNVFRYSEYSELKGTQTVASHSWRLSLMATVMSKEFEIDTEKALKIAIVHDIAESITGDVDHSLVYTGKVKDKGENEKKAFETLKGMLSEKLGKEIEELWLDYEDKRNEEARFVYALDKIEALIYIIENAKKEIHYPHMIATYADNAVLNFPKLKPVLKDVKLKLKELFLENNVEWKEEYDEV